MLFHRDRRATMNTPRPPSAQRVRAASHHLVRCRSYPTNEGRRRRGAFGLSTMALRTRPCTLLPQAPDPAVRDLEFPSRDKPRAGERRIQGGVALGEAVPAGRYQGIIRRKALCEKAEPLENRTVAKPVAISQQGFIIALAVRKVDGEAIRNMLDTAAKGRVIEHVDDGAVKVGDGDLVGAAPDSFRAEKKALIDVLERKGRAVALLLLVAQGLGREHNDIAENLLGEVPVLGSATPADIGGIIEDWDKYPGIIENMDAIESVQGSGGIDAGTDAAQPALSGPPRKDLGGLGAGDGQGGFCVGDADDIPRGAQNLHKALAGYRQCRYEFPHSLSYMHKFPENDNL